MFAKIRFRKLPTNPNDRVIFFFFANKFYCSYELDSKKIEKRLLLLLILLLLLFLAQMLLNLMNFYFNLIYEFSITLEIE